MPFQPAIQDTPDWVSQFANRPPLYPNGTAGGGFQTNVITNPGEGGDPGPGGGTGPSSPPPSPPPSSGPPISHRPLPGTSPGSGDPTSTGPAGGWTWGSDQIQALLNALNGGQSGQSFIDAYNTHFGLQPGGSLAYYGNNNTYALPSGYAAIGPDGKWGWNVRTGTGSVVDPVGNVVI